MPVASSPASPTPYAQSQSHHSSFHRASAHRASAHRASAHRASAHRASAHRASAHRASAHRASAHRASAHRASAHRASRRVAAGGLLLLALGACRSDSIIAPQQPDRPICESSGCTPANAPKPNASIVIDPLEDATARILPYLMDGRARADLTPVLNALRSDLLAGNLQLARIQLAMAYDAVDAAGRRLSNSGDASVVLDLAELSAIRLALVPAAAALGVAAQ